ncbi:hypothetical protein, partial [Escherichia coli]|uniref:hypothetical protein n=1 Tax=Escherichia coli TaxID=562 RepID=UPI001BD40F58
NRAKLDPAWAAFGRQGQEIAGDDAALIATVTRRLRNNRTARTRRFTARSAAGSATSGKVSARRPEPAISSRFPRHQTFV